MGQEFSWFKEPKLGTYTFTHKGSGIKTVINGAPKYETDGGGIMYIFLNGGNVQKFSNKRYQIHYVSNLVMPEGPPFEPEDGATNAQDSQGE